MDLIKIKTDPLNPDNVLVEIDLINVPDDPTASYKTLTYRKDSIRNKKLARNGLGVEVVMYDNSVVYLCHASAMQTNHWPISHVSDVATTSAEDIFEKLRSIF